MTTTGSILSTRGLTLRFSGVDVIESLDIDVAACSRTAIIGPNGAGKTALFNLISGVFRPTEGQILYGGCNLVDEPLVRRVRLGIGRTFQNVRLMKHLTVLENVMVGQQHRTSLFATTLIPLLSSLNREAINDAREAISAVGLLADANRLAEGLPYGVQKRVELARALVTRPKLLLLDEPAAGLNTAEREDLSRALREAVDSSVTLLLIEHDIGFLSRLCSEAIVLSFGRKIAEGPFNKVQKDRNVIDAYLGTELPIDDTEDTRTKLRNAHSAMPSGNRGSPTSAMG